MSWGMSEEAKNRFRDKVYLRRRYCEKYGYRASIKDTNSILVCFPYWFDSEQYSKVIYAPFYFEDVKVKIVNNFN